jgi:structure-specific endonuclease subunit SLX1
LQDTIAVLTDYGPAASTATGMAENGESSDAPAQRWGIHALPLDYGSMKAYVTKTQSIFSFEREGNCVVCRELLPPGEGLYAACSNTGCEGVGHVSCWSQHLLREIDDDEIMPVSGQCPKCHGDVKWGDMMKELTLRTRGQKLVEKLLKKPARKKTNMVDD